MQARAAQTENGGAESKQRLLAGGQIGQHGGQGQSNAGQHQAQSQIGARLRRRQRQREHGNQDIGEAHGEKADETKAAEERVGGG
jgi:hypothetical protein